MYIGIIAPTLERKHSPTKQRFELYHHVNTLRERERAQEGERQRQRERVLVGGGDGIMGGANIL